MSLSDIKHELKTMLDIECETQSASVHMNATNSRSECNVEWRTPNRITNSCVVNERMGH